MVDNGGHQEWRYDDEAQPGAVLAPDDHPFAAYVSAALRPRRDGWTAARQRAFLERLAQDGNVAGAAVAVGLSARSAFRLRVHPKARAFARGWDAPLLTASHHLLAIPFQRALTGTPRAINRDGHVVAEQLVPSDRILMFLLRHLHPDLFGGDITPTQAANRIGARRDSFGEDLAANSQATSALIT